MRCCLIESSMQNFAVGAFPNSGIHQERLSAAAALCPPTDWTTIYERLTLIVFLSCRPPLPLLARKSADRVPRKWSHNNNNWPHLHPLPLIDLQCFSYHSAVSHKLVNHFYDLNIFSLSVAHSCQRTRFGETLVWSSAFGDSFAVH